MEAPSTTKPIDPTKPSITTLSVEASQGEPCPLRKMFAVASMAAGIQFGWALQLSLLTLYVQLLGVPHAATSFIWLCGPISGLVVQPIVGYYSDRSTSRFGRRRPFIHGGAVAVAIAVFLIGYAADIGYSAGDDKTRKTRPRAVAVFVIGFWILDVANSDVGHPSDGVKIGSMVSFTILGVPLAVTFSLCSLRVLNDCVALVCVKGNFLV
ncbi:hypothetical protein VNO80_13508 [Phaseolus coccineus]|uniref:Sucrose transporter n=1 Tax=Phaseolus coccineus TaxID=3886 RepID=A0AAN9N346_PHACN